MGKWRAAPSRTVGPRVMQSRLHAGGIPFAASDAAPHRHAVRTCADAGVPDLGLFTQLLADLVGDVVEPLLLQLVHVHGREDVGAAAKVEPDELEELDVEF